MGEVSVTSRHGPRNAFGAMKLPAMPGQATSWIVGGADPATAVIVTVAAAVGVDRWGVRMSGLSLLNASAWFCEGSPMTKKLVPIAKPEPKVGEPVPMASNVQVSSE